MYKYRVCYGYFNSACDPNIDYTVEALKVKPYDKFEHDWVR